MKAKSQEFQYTLVSLEKDFVKFAENFRMFCETNKMDEAKIFDMELSLEELIVNSFSHGSPDGKVEVTARIQKKELQVTIRDKAPPFNLLEEAPPPPSGSLSERKVGGLGIHLIKNLSDRIEYSGSPEGNCVTLFKAI